jgi:ribonuclease VapC
MASVMSSVVFDASAVLALLLRETGASEVEAKRGSAVWSAVNYSEVIAKLTSFTRSPEETVHRVDRLELKCVAFDRELAVQAASLRPVTQSLGLSLADRACLALAMSRRVPVLTADRAWGQLQLGIDIILIR